MHVPTNQKSWNRFPGEYNSSDSPRNETIALRRKTLLVISTTLAGLTGVLYLTTSAILTKGFNSLEERTVQRNAERVLGAYTEQLNELENINFAWSAWDDTYSFVQNPTDEYIEMNLVEDLSLRGTASTLVFVDATGQIVFGGGYAPDAVGANMPISNSLRHYIQTHPELLEHKTLDNCQTGVILLPENPMMYSACPIITSQFKGPSVGTLIMGRYIDSAWAEELGQRTRLNVSFHSLNDLDQLSAKLQKIYHALMTETSVLIQPQTEEWISGYLLIHNNLDEPQLLVQINLPREIHQQGKKSLHYLILPLAIVGGLFCITTQLLLKRLIHCWFQQRESEARYKTVVAQASEGIILIDADTKHFLEVNTAFQNLLGYSVLELQDLTLYDVVASDRDTVNQNIQTFLAANHTLAQEQKYRHHDGTLVDVEVNANCISYAGREVFCLVIRDITERKRSEVALRESEQRLAWQASHDPLTGLLNRREFERYLSRALKDAKARNQHYSLCYLDLDQFKVVNDTCGHRAGDELLQQVTGLLQSKLRSTDVLARLGGDEFGLLLSNCPPEQGIYVADIVRQGVQEFRFVWQDKVFTIGVSVGLVGINANSQGLTSVLSAADAACYVAKNKGRNRVHVYHADDHDLLQQHQEMQWATRLTQALESNQFCLYYQSIAPISQTLTTGEHYEVLLRLQDSSGELIPPGAFIPAAERYNLMHLIDRWVIRTLFASKAQHYQHAWALSQANGCQYLYAINLSGASINDDQFANFLHEQFALHQIPPQVICFEITETVAIGNLSKATQFIQEFKHLGCQFALDDFGSGMSSFAYLRTLPVDFLKIDGGFIRDILDDPADLVMVEAINRVGHVMGIQTIAEFVQNELILDQLKAIGIDYAQGYGIAVPRPLEVPISHVSCSIEATHPSPSSDVSSDASSDVISLV